MARPRRLAAAMASGSRTEPPGRTAARASAEIEAVSDYPFDDQVVGRAREAVSDSNVDLPLRGQIEVEGRKDLVLLLGQRIEARHRTHRAVVLDSRRDLLRGVVTEFEVRRKLESFGDAFAVEGAVEGGIERPIPAAHLLVHDRPNFPGPGVGRKFPPLIADFVGNAYANGPVPAIGRAKTRADVAPHPVPAVPGSGAGEDVQAGLEPGREAARDLDGFVPGMIRGRDPALSSFAALGGEVAVQLDHGLVGRDRVVRVDLDFVVFLGRGAAG